MARKKSINDIEAQLRRISLNTRGVSPQRAEQLVNRAREIAARYQDNIRRKGGLENVFQNDDYVGTMMRNRDKKVSQRVYMKGLSNG